MNLANIKLPLAVIGVIVAQAFGIIWYVATLDSTVSSLEVTVEEIRLNTAKTSVAVIQNDIANIKINVEKLEQSASSKVFDDGALWKAVDGLSLEVESRDGEVRLGLEEMRQGLDGRATSKDLKKATQAIQKLEAKHEAQIVALRAEIVAVSETLRSVLDGKGAVWKKSALKASIDALKQELVTVGEDIEENHPPKRKEKRKK
jgi:hypothetical protein